MRGRMREGRMNRTIVVAICMIVAMAMTMLTRDAPVVMANHIYVSSCTGDETNGYGFTVTYNDENPVRTTTHGPWTAGPHPEGGTQSGEYICQYHRNLHLIQVGPLINSHTSTPRPTATPTETPTVTMTATLTVTPTPTATRRPTRPGDTPEPPTPTATVTPTETVVPVETATPTSTPAASAPSVPQLTAQAAAAAVELRWTEVSGAARYELMVWWDAGTGWQPIGGANLTGTAYTHTNVTAGTTYYYTIRAVNAAGGTSGWLGAETNRYPSVTASQEVPAGGTSTATPAPTATAAGLSTPTPAASAPSVPQLTAQARADAVDLRWTEVQGAVRYELMVWWDPLPAWQPIGGANLTGTSYTHTNVTAGTTYYYTIRAVNAAGGTNGWLGAETNRYPSVTASQEVPAGGTSTATPAPTATAAGLSTPTPAASAPSVPQLTAQARADAVDLRWTEVQGAVRYELMVWWDPLPAWQPIGGANLTGTSYTHTNVTAGTTYYYTIRAVNAAGGTNGWLGAETNRYPSVTPR